MTLRHLPFRAVLLILFAVAFIPLSGLTQSTPLTGKVTDPDGNPVPGASVRVKGSAGGTSTAADGTFSLQVERRTDLTIEVSSVGFTARDVVVGSDNNITIQLDQDAQSMNAVVVVGYGTQRRKDVTGSVVSLDRKRLDNMPNANFYEALQGAAPGVQINTNGGGAEGNNMSIVIRGQKSINGSRDVLIILDGIPYNGSISDINPTDIASVEILKDASAMAIYGAKSANGVILITTKRGSGGKPVFSYDGFWGTQQYANLPPVLTPEEFYQFKQTREPGIITSSEQEIYDAGRGVNWLDLATRNGQRMQHSLSVRGGNDKFKYYASLSLLDVKGIAVNDNFKRMSSRVNMEVLLTSWLTYGTNTQLNYNDRSGVGPSFGGNYGAYFFNPLTTPYDSLGKLTVYPWPEDPFFENPLAPTLARNRDHTYKLFTTNYLHVKLPFVPGLSYRLNTGIEYQARDIATYYGRDTRTGLLVGGRLTQTNSNTRNYVVENILNYDKQFGKHNLGMTGLYSFQDDIANSNGLTAEGFPNDVLTFYQANVAQLVTPTASLQKVSTISQMLRINYNYDSRYLLTLTGRRDGNSGFGDNNKFGFFPVAAIGWNIDQEKFFPWSNTVNALKLRMSYGSNGNIALSPYQTLARLSTRSYIDDINTAPGYLPTTFSSPDLRWETSTTANVAIDFGLWNNRLQGTVEYYTSKTKDLLLNRSVSSVQGITQITQNIGRTSNRGFELTLSGTIIDKNDFSWTANGNLSLNRNRIDDLYGDALSDTLNQWFIGHPIDVRFGYVYGGVWQQKDDTLNTPQGPVRAGDARVVDINNDGIINAYDRTIIGNIQPDFIWGLGNTFKYKNVSLYVFLYGVQGRNEVNTLITDNNVNNGVRYNTVRKNWWTPDNPTNEFYRNIPNANPRSAGIVESSSFVRVRDISLMYEFGGKVLGRTGLTRLNVYVQARNLFTFTKWSGLDPEFSTQTTTPLQKEVLVGLNVSF